MELTTSIQVIVATEPGLNLHGTGCPFWNVLVSNTRASAGLVQLPDEGGRTGKTAVRHQNTFHTVGFRTGDTEL